MCVRRGGAVLPHAFPAEPTATGCLLHQVGPVSHFCDMHQSTFLPTLETPRANLLILSYIYARLDQLFRRKHHHSAYRILRGTRRHPGDTATPGEKNVNDKRIPSTSGDVWIQS